MASTRLVVMSISKSEPLPWTEIEDAFDGDAAQGQVLGELATVVQPGCRLGHVGYGIQLCERIFTICAT